jgi:hypothetical protein
MLQGMTYKMVIPLIQSVIQMEFILATDNIQRFTVMHGTKDILPLGPVISASVSAAASPKSRPRRKWPAK